MDIISMLIIRIISFLIYFFAAELFHTINDYVTRDVLFFYEKIFCKTIDTYRTKWYGKKFLITNHPDLPQILLTFTISLV